MHNRPFTTELLEARLLLSKATNAAIEKFNLSPAVFVENDGQWTDSSVRFVHQGQGASIAMTDRGPIFELYKDVTAVDSSVDDRLDGRLDSRFDEPIERSIESTRFSVSFQNSNITTPIGHDQSSSTFNYNIGTLDLHRSNVHGFEKIVYPDLYDGIDLHTWGQRDSLKYEFHVAPNIDYRQIKVQYEGVEDLWIDDRGRLHAELGNGFGEVIDDSPVIWQEVKGKRADVAGKFKLLDGNAGGDAYTFELTGKFDPNLPLVIDPDLAWGSYLGGSNGEWGDHISVDVGGNVWVIGRTSSSGWTVGGFDTSYNGADSDPFVAKISVDGTLVWSSYLGGNGNDEGRGISVDANGCAWVTGETGSTGWTVGGFDTSHNGGTFDAFVAKINADGALAWSSYLGGSFHDSGNGICVDADGNAWVTGFTLYSGWTVGGFDTSRDGGSDGFVAKINANGALAWSSYIGGSVGDSGHGIAADASGNAWVTGTTSSTNWTVGGFDTSHNGITDPFIAKINANGTLAWSSYLGGSANDNGYGIAVDANGNAWLTGQTNSSEWAVSGFDTSHNGSFDAFIAKINADGTLAWSSYLGGSVDEFGRGITVDASGNAWLTGQTNSSEWAVSGFDTSYNGGTTDAFIAKIDADGTLAWSSYLGGIASDRGYGIAVDPSGNAWVTGYTNSSGWTVGGFDTSHNGSSDAFIAKITDQSDITIPIFENSTFNYLNTSEQTLTAAFNENISASLAAADFVLTNLNTTTNIPLTLQSISTDGQSATFTFSATGNDLGGAILTDGHYRIRALAGQIEDASGNALASDVDHFFEFKNADVANADHVVDFSDLLVVAQNYGMTGATFADGDVNYDGVVNFTDLLAVAQRYNTGIPELRINRANPTKSRSIIGDVFSADTRIV